jgi:hypothetical protein
MKKSILSILLTASMTLAAVSFAQTDAATPTLQHASPVAAPTYLGLGYDKGILQVSTSTTQADALSPKVQTIAFKNDQLPAGFEALHTNTGLTEVVGYYWDALSKLGFTGSVDSESRRVVSYRFSNGNGRLMAVFTQNEKGVLADLSWTSAELVATAN